MKKEIKGRKNKNINTTLPENTGTIDIGFTYVKVDGELVRCPTSVNVNFDRYINALGIEMLKMGFQHAWGHKICGGIRLLVTRNETQPMDQSDYDVEITMVCADYAKGFSCIVYEANKNGEKIVKNKERFSVVNNDWEIDSWDFAFRQLKEYLKNMVSSGNEN